MVFPLLSYDFTFIIVISRDPILRIFEFGPSFLSVHKLR